MRSLFVKVQNISKFSFLLFFVFFLLEFLIAYLQIFTGLGGGIYSDVRQHLAWIPYIGHLNFPEMGFEYTVLFLSKISNLSYQWVAIILLSFSVGAQAFIVSFLLKTMTKINELKRIFFTIIVMTCSSIYIPYFNHSLNKEHIKQKLSSYFLTHPHSQIIDQVITSTVKFFSHYAVWGIGSPSVYNSPTLTIVKLMGLVITCLYLHNNNNDSARSDIKITLFVSGCLIISCFYKPGFATIFIPAVIFYECFIKQNTISISLKKAAIITLPSIITLGAMYAVLAYVNSPPSFQQTHVYFVPRAHVYFAPFEVISLYVKSAFGAAIEALAFPLLVLLFRFKEIISGNRYLQFSWIMLIFGYFYWALLAQSGSSFSSQNFVWGYDCGLFFVYLFSVIEYIKLMTTSKDNGKMKLQLYVLTFMLFLSCFSGIIFLLRTLLDVGAS